MNQAYQHIEPGTHHYENIKASVIKLVDQWNSTHIKPSNHQGIFDACKTIFKYHRWISVDNIESIFELGLMGEYGENKGLNSETIFNWFKVSSAMARKDKINHHTAYQTSNEPELSEEQKQAKRQEVRTELIEVFMKYYNVFVETGEIDATIKKYYVVFWAWFRKLGLVDITEEEENRLNEVEAKHLRDLRSKLRSPELSDAVYKKFIEIFRSLEGFDIENQLNSIKL